jgi:hypothetical protein
MLARIQRILAAILILVVCRWAGDQAAATVVRDMRTGSGNPAVESGGHHLLPGPPPAVPYSLIGAIEAGSRWCLPVVWPWRLFGSFALHRHGIPAEVRAARAVERPSDFSPLP